jgi:hypothetical protein
LDEAAYEEAINNVDYFLKGEKAPPKDEEDLEGDLASDEMTDEDLEKIVNESNEEPSQQNTNQEIKNTESTGAKSNSPSMSSPANPSPDENENAELEKSLSE